MYKVVSPMACCGGLVNLVMTCVESILSLGNMPLTRIVNKQSAMALRAG